jgi:hypothetical protein
VALALTLCAGLAGAEMGGDDYRSLAAPPDAATRKRLDAELASERQREADRTARQEAARRAEEARRAALLAARPLGERLLDARCTACHTLGVLEGREHGALGWRWTVERMHWWHGAPLGPGEAAVIAEQLYRGRAATPWRAAAEMAALLGVLLAAPVSILILHRARRRRRASA